MRKKKAMTLIELMLVVVILGIMTAIVSVRIIPHRKLEAMKRKAKAELDIISIALEMYRSDVGRYPTAAYGLEELVANRSGEANWKGPYLRLGTRTVERGGCKWKGRRYEEAEVPLDPWGNEYVYADEYDIEDYAPGQSSLGCCGVICFGADRERGGTGWNEDFYVVCIK